MKKTMKKVLVVIALAIFLVGNVHADQLINSFEDGGDFGEWIELAGANLNTSTSYVTDGSYNGQLVVPASPGDPVTIRLDLVASPKPTREPGNSYLALDVWGNGTGQSLAIIVYDSAACLTGCQAVTTTVNSDNVIDDPDVVWIDLAALGVNDPTQIDIVRPRLGALHEIWIDYLRYTNDVGIPPTPTVTPTRTITQTSLPTGTFTCTPTITITATESSTPTVTPTQEIVVFPDANLEAAVRSTIGKPVGDIYKSDLVGLALLDAHGSGVSDLTGLEECDDLVSLFLSDNAISDLTPLAGLANLDYLELSSNTINDLTPLAGLTGLQILLLDSNSISNLGPLSGLSSLTTLTLSSNTINDVTSLGSITTLTILNLNNNSISNLVPLATLTALTSLSLDDNSISNLGPLASLTALTALAINGNSVADITALASLSELTQLSLQDNSISNIGSLSALLKLDNLLLRNNSISDVGALVTNSDGGGLSGGDWIDLRGNPLGSQALNVDVPYLMGKSINVMYDAPPTPTVTPVCSDPPQLSIMARVCSSEYDYIYLRMDGPWLDCASAYFEVQSHPSSGELVRVDVEDGNDESCWARYYPEPGWKDIDAVYAHAKDGTGCWGVSGGSLRREVCSGGEAGVRNNKIYPLQSSEPAVVQFAAGGRCRVVVYNRAGEVVAGLLGSGSTDFVELDEGAHEVSWCGESLAGPLVSSGIYTIVVETPEYVRKFKIVVIK